MPENEEKNVSETPETPPPQDVDTPEDIAIQAAVMAGYMRCYHDNEANAAREDMEDRSDPDLRIQMVELVEQLGELITEFGEKLQQKRCPKEFDPFEADVCKDLIAWQLAEFTSMAMLPRQDETYQYTPKGGQFTRAHGCYWWSVEEHSGDDSLYVRAKVKPAPEADEEGDQDEESEGESQGPESAPETPANILTLPADLPGYPSIETAGS